MESYSICLLLWVAGFSPYHNVLAAHRYCNVYRVLFFYGKIVFYCTCHIWADLLRDTWASFCLLSVAKRAAMALNDLFTIHFTVFLFLALRKKIAQNFFPTICFLLIKAPYLWLRHLKTLYIVCQRFSQTVAPPFQPSGGHIEPSRELSIPPSPTQLLSVYNKLQTSTHALRRETEWLEFKGLFPPTGKKNTLLSKGRDFHRVFEILQLQPWPGWNFIALHQNSSKI